MISKESPLKGINVGTDATVAIRELPALHTIDLRVAPRTSTQTAIEEILGFELPAKTGQITFGISNEAYALCLAPDWWLIVRYEETEQKLSSLKLNNEHHFSAVNVTGQRTTIELEGANVRDVLTHLWEQDLREKKFPVASVSQSLMAKAPVVVCHIAPFRYRIMVRSSFALHLWKALVDAAEEYF